MSLKTLGKLFIGIGLILLVYGLTMDTSVSTGYGRVVNIGLANDRLMLVLIGGVVFIGGVVLFSVHKVKQSKDDEINEQAEIEKKREERKAQILETSKGISAKIAKDFVVSRLVHGVSIAFLITSIATFALRSEFWGIWLVYVGMLILLFRPIDHHKAISQGWLVAAGAMIYLIAHLLTSGLVFRNHDYVMPIDIYEVMAICLLLIPAAGFIFISKRYRSKMSSSVADSIV